MSSLVPPHGGRLLPLLISGDARDRALNEAETLPRIGLSSREVSDQDCPEGLRWPSHPSHCGQTKEW